VTKKYSWLIHHDTIRKVSDYLLSLRNAEQPGILLKKQLNGAYPEEISPEELLEKLIKTKIPQIFAETSVSGDGSDWNQKELSILGDVSVSVPVTVFDNGRHTDPDIHEVPFKANLLFTPGALLRNDMGRDPADWNEVTISDTLNPEGYYQLYRRRLLPLLLHTNEVAERRGRKAFITVPGLGCGQFAGPFKGMLGTELKKVLIRLLKEFGSKFNSIHCIYYDPYRECENERYLINGISLLVRPLTKGNWDKPQLCKPEQYEEEGDSFLKCDLWSVVAWDHVSWPGNDFYTGSRVTDDGVKAAATDSMSAITGIKGKYDEASNCYLPPEDYENWFEVAARNRIELEVGKNLIIKPGLN
jgi:hypothetical protein